MKRPLFILFLITALCLSAQMQADNPFNQSVNTNNSSVSDREGKPGDENEGDDGGMGGPGNPGDPSPIDDYVPYLIITGMGMIAYFSYNRRVKLDNSK